MVTEKLKLILNNYPFQSKLIFSSDDVKNLKKNIVKHLKTVSLCEIKDLESRIWWSENIHRLLDILSKVSAKNLSLQQDTFHLTKLLIKEQDFLLRKDHMMFLLNLWTEKTSLNDNELKRMKDVFLLSLSSILSEEITKGNELFIPYIFRRFHEILSFDFSSVTPLFSVLEKTLRYDPSGEYQRMTRDSQNLYKDKINKLSRRRNVSSELLAEEFLEKSRLSGVHIGKEIMKKKKNRFYFPILILLNAIVLLDMMIQFKFSYLLILLLPSVYFGIRRILDFIYSKTIRSEILPSLKIDRVDEEQKTCVVITSLITTKKDINELKKKINIIRINNKNENDNIYFGLILDLAESKSEVMSKDQELISFVEETVKSLNEEDNCFFAVLRKRVHHKSEERYTGWERKRGAIEELIAYLCNENFPNAHFFGVASKLRGTKYLITLDQDTELGIGQAYRLIGMMHHSINRPVISNNGRPRVVSGHGIIQPKIGSTLLEPITTPFAKINSNGSGGVLYSGASFDLMQDLFHEGNFCGKGIIDVNAFYQVLRNQIPEQSILSHDMPEGALLRCGLASNEYFVDSNPQNCVSSYKRMHRWIRGDTQNLRLFLRLNPLRRWFLLDNLFHHLLPLSQFLSIVLSMALAPKYSAVVVLLVAFYHLIPVITTALNVLLCRNYQLVTRRFSTKSMNLICNTLYQSLISFSAILFEAYYFTDAVIRSMIRMIFSKKHLLQWQVYHPFGDHDGSFKFTFISIPVSTILLFFANHILCLITILLWIFYPILCAINDIPYQKKEKWNENEKKKLLDYATNEMRFFFDFVSDKTNHLPCDNVQFQPIEKMAMRTSPTNIGLYLASLCCALRLKLIQEKDFIKKVKATVNSINILEKYHGHLYNWYDINSLKVIGKRTVSSVDSGNFVACLIVLSETLRGLENESGDARDLRLQIDLIIKNADFRYLFSSEKGFFLVEIEDDGSEQSNSCYDLLMSEARITSYLSISLGQIPHQHWSRLSRPLLSFGGRVGIASWSGTAFEYFMPSLFLPTVENSLTDESLDFAFYCQQKYRSYLMNHEYVFGISESGYSATDHEDQYQYNAFGVPYLSIAHPRFGKKVISPYSSYLMLERNEKQILSNLNNLTKLGLFTERGFYEACEFNSNFADDYSTIYSFMSHHKGMSVLALTNAITDGWVRDQFMGYENFEAKRELLAERFPIEGTVSKRNKIIDRQTNRDYQTNNCVVDFSKNITAGRMITDGKMSVIVYNNGIFRILCHGKDLIDFKHQLLTFSFQTGNNIYFLHDFEKVKVEFCDDLVRFIFKHNKLSGTINLIPIGGKDSFQLQFIVNGLTEKTKVTLSFKPILQFQKDYDSHPAFQDLSLEAKYHNSILSIRKRGVEKHSYLHLKSNHSMISYIGNHSYPICDDYTALLSDNLNIEFEIDSRVSVSHSVLFQYSEFETAHCEDNLLDGSGNLISSVKKSSSAKIRALSNRCCCDQDSDQLEQEFLLHCFSNKRLIQKNNRSLDKDFLWKNGISGDYPIILFNTDSSKNLEEELRPFFSLCQKLNFGGIRVDLVILQPSEHGYFRDHQRKITECVTKYSCSHLIGKHPGIHVISCDNKQDIDAFYDVSCYSNSYFADDILQTEDFDYELKSFSENASDQASVIDVDGESVLIDKEQFNPKVPLSHVIANKRIGFVCDQNSLGFTWYRNSALGRISKWENNIKKDQGEKIYLVYRGKRYDLLQSADKVRYSFYCVHYSGKIDEQAYTVTATASARYSSKIIFIHLSDPLSNGKIEYSLTPVNGQFPDKNLFVYPDSEWIRIERVIKSDLDFFSWVYSDKEKNIKVYDDGVLISQEASEENLIMLGAASNDYHYEWLKKEIKTLDIESLINEERRKMRELMPHSFADEKDFWISYQCVVCRFLARSALYQSGGAFGFRDQLQDSLIFLNFNPKICAEHIIRSASHQFEEGDVLHWWHTNPKSDHLDSGIRSRCSDDYLWLLFVTSEYLNATNDYDILETSVPYIKGPSIAEGNDEIYCQTTRGKTATLRDHLLKAAELFMTRGLGENQLPFMGSCDWNDGMNKIDGESVWLAFFGAICLNRCKKILDQDKVERINSFLGKMKEGIESAYNGIWFLRVISSDGRVFGNDISLESECSIDLITQAFAAFYQLEFKHSEFALDDKKILRALDASFENLANEKSNTVALFSKPFAQTNPSPGYIQRYVKGVRENGGQYTHAAVWFSIASILYGIDQKNDKIYENGIRIQKMIDPFKNNNMKQFKIYQREPYVLCGDVYTAKRYRGHGGWSWYTGAASWYYKLLKIIEQIQRKRNID